MNLRHLHYLQLILQTGSFAAAAREAGVTQPALSQAMQAMALEWEVALFEKSGRRKLPTPAALRLAEQAQGLQRTLGELAVLASAEKPRARVPQTAPDLQVGTSPAAALLLAPVIQQAWAQQPSAGLLRFESGSSHGLLNKLQSGVLDLVIGPRPRHFATEGLRHHRLYTSTPTIQARAHHPLAGATSLPEIRDAAWVVAGEVGTPGNVIEEAHRVRRLASPRIQVQCGDYTTLLKIVAHSDLLAVVPHPALLDGYDAGALRPIAIREGLPQYEVCLFWRSVETPERQRALAPVLAALGAGPGGRTA